MGNLCTPQKSLSPQVLNTYSETYTGLLAWELQQVVSNVKTFHGKARWAHDIAETDVCTAVYADSSCC